MSRDRTAAKARDAAPASRAKAVAVWTPERVAAVAKRHAEGAWLKHACALEGGTYDGLIDAMARDPEIRQVMAEAHAKGAAELHRLKQSALPGTDDWKKYAWDLERWDQATFHLTTKVESKSEVTGKDGAPLVPQPVPVTMAERRARVVAELAKLDETARDMAELMGGKKR